MKAIGVIIIDTPDQSRRESQMRERGCYRDYLTKMYDEDYFVKSGRDLSVSRIERTISLFGEVTAKTILDLGCGTGEGSVLLGG